MSARFFRFLSLAFALAALGAYANHAQALTLGANLVTAHMGGYEGNTTEYVDRYCRATAPGDYQCSNSSTFVNERHDYRSSTPGLYLRLDNGLTAGAYRNSLGRTSVHAGYTWQSASQRFALTVGAATGYRERGLVPLVLPSVRMPLSDGTALRLSLLPKAGRTGPTALHLSVEADL